MSRNACTEKLDILLEEALEKRYFPCATAVVGDREQVYYRRTLGWSRVFADETPCFDVTPSEIPVCAIAASADTIYDMASLSKLMATTMIAFKLIEEGKLSMQDSISRFLDGVPGEKRGITIFHLMTHTSGITAHFHLGGSAETPAQAVQAILERPFSHPIGSEVEYSCMGYIVLGKILEKIGGLPLDKLAEKYVFEPLGMTSTCYNPLEKGISPDKIAATEFNRGMNRYICGVVHDENARFLNGVSANAGVFSCADDVIRFASMLAGRGRTPNGRYLSQSLFREAIRNYTPGKADDRGWGFQLKSDGLSAMGDLYSAGSYGHNGFTGTSLYVDHDTGLYVILLTNRVHFTRESAGLFRFRRIFHNAALSMVY